MQKNFYFEFENKFRGSRNEIKNRLSNYQGLLDYILVTFDSPKSLDIGCGRGEWLEICNNQGIHSLGIESDIGMYEFCKALNLDVIKDDAIKSLSRYAENSFQIISAFHLIEHLDNSQLDILIHQCQRILEPRGVLILETPSIDNIKVSTNSFYLDHTHINHINPDGLLYRLQSFGFDHVKYYLINCVKSLHAKSKLLTECLDSVAQDVVFIATIDNEENSFLFSQENLWKDKLNIAIATNQALSLFDEKIVNIEQNIKLKNKEYEMEISNLDKKIEFLLFRQNKLFNSIPFKIIRKLQSYIKFSLLSIKRFFIFCLHATFQLITSTLSENQTIIFYRLAAKLFKYIGKDNLARKILSKIIKIDQIDFKSDSLNDMLLGYYSYSIKAKKIFETLNK